MNIGHEMVAGSVRGLGGGWLCVKRPSYFLNEKGNSKFLILY